MIEPTFRPVSLTELQDEGVLLAANEAFFWPLGLALTWSHDTASGVASDLHVRQWVFEDGHTESIAADEGDPICAQRRSRFALWSGERKRAIIRGDPTP